MKKIIALLLLAAMLVVSMSSCAVDMEDFGSIIPMYLATPQEDLDPTEMIYDKDFVRDLCSCHQKNPGCVCGRRVHRMTKDNAGQIRSYNDWQWECRDILEPSHQLFTTGCGGVLYPPHILPQEAFDAAAIKAHCLNTDDVWLKFMELKAGARVVFNNSKVMHPLTIRKTQASALMHTNTAAENRNDLNIKAMESFTGIKLADYAVED